MALMTSGIGGHRDFHDRLVGDRTLSIGVAWVGLGRAAGRNPRRRVSRAIIARSGARGAIQFFQ